MSQGSDIEESLTVSNDGVTVEKTVSETEFPVPAIVFTLQSNASTSVHVRLTDRIPESFPMERIGFHPEFESDRWTAYKDHRVEFERDLDPGESVKTVYGIRTDDSDGLAAFLTEPEIKEVAARESQEAADIEGVLGPDNSQLIRDVLSGERSSLPGIDEDADDPLAESAADDPIAAEEDPLSESDEPLGVDDEPIEADMAEPAAETGDEAQSDEDDIGALLDDADSEEPLTAPEDDSEPGAEAHEDDAIVGESEPMIGDDESETMVGDDESETTVGDDESDTAEEPTDEHAETEEEPKQEQVPDADDADGQDDDVAEVSADEVAGDIDEPDEGTDESAEKADEPPIQPAAGIGANTDSTAEDGSSLVAVQGGIAAVLAAEIRNGNVSEEDMALLKKELGTDVPRSVEVRLSRLQSQVETFAAYSEALESFIDENGTADELLTRVDNGLDELEETVDDLTMDIADAADERESLSADITSVKTTAESAADRVDTLEADLDDATAQIDGLDDDLGSLIDDVDALYESIETLGEELEEAIEDVEAEVSETATTAGEAAATADRVERTVESTTEDVDDLQAAIDNVESNIDTLQTELSEATASLQSELAEAMEALDQIDEKADRSTVRSLQRRIDSLEEDVETVEAFRERLSGVFMGNGPSMDESEDSESDTEQ